MDSEISRAFGNRARRFGVHATQLSAGAARVSSLAPAGTTATARMGNTPAGRFSRLSAFSGEAPTRPGGYSTTLLRAAHVLQVPHPVRHSGRFANQKPGLAE